MEIKSGEGGEESALFAADLLKMYSRYAESRGWKVEVLDAQETDLGGYKSVTVAIKAPVEEGLTRCLRGTQVRRWCASGATGAGHRVQGRLHTSAAGVLVMPEVAETEVAVDEGDLRIDVYRSSGPGGQGVNTTDSAVRITHLPSGIVVSCQNERSQLQNREQAMRMLRARLTAAAEEAASAASAARRSQVRTVDRSERIRTYNFPENRISDHRIGFKSYNLDQVLNGDLDAVIKALRKPTPSCGFPRSVAQAREQGCSTRCCMWRGQLREGGVASPDQEARQLLAYAAGRAGAASVARCPSRMCDRLPSVDQQARASGAAAAPDRSGSLSLPGT